jgi:spore photoproduct lyase
LGLPGRVAMRVEKMNSPVIKRVVVEEEALGLGRTSAWLRALPHVPVEIRPADSQKVGQEGEMGKEVLHILRFKGAFLKPCPGTKTYICCGYQILNIGTNCPMDCSYCILQAYFNQPNLRVFANIDEEIDRVLAEIDRNPDHIFRIGTGEFTDSLALEPLLKWSELLLPRLCSRRNVLLELKTKTTHVEGLIDAPFRDRVVISWSLNSPRMVSREERGAATLKKRIETAGRCQREGFTVGFHFDPLVAHTDWREGYLRTIDLLDRHVDPKKVIWMSLGSFRFMPNLKQVIRRRHPASELLRGEFVTGLDGKMRYFKPIRMGLYGFVREHLDRWHPNLGLYLCMESDEVWEAAMGWSPGDSEGLSSYLDGRVAAFFG